LKNQKVSKKSLASETFATTLFLRISRNPSRSEFAYFPNLQLCPVGTFGLLTKAVAQNASERVVSKILKCGFSEFNRLPVREKAMVMIYDRARKNGLAE
jgi:hypothetical protein